MTHLKFLTLALFALTLLAPQASAKSEKRADLKVGDKAPAFEKSKVSGKR